MIPRHPVQALPGFQWPVLERVWTDVAGGVVTYRVIAYEPSVVGYSVQQQPGNG